MKRILLIDDCIDILDSVSLVLEEHYDITAVTNGEDALALVEEQRFDVILVDLMMPIIDGASFIRSLRQRRDRTPVVLMSAAVDLHERGPALGVMTLPKPFDALTLLRVLEAAMRARRPPTLPRGIGGEKSVVAS